MGIRFNKRAVSLYEEHCEPLKEVFDGLALVLSYGAGKSPSDLLDLIDGDLVPSTQRLHWKWDDNHPLPLTGPCLFLIPFVGSLGERAQG